MTGTNEINAAELISSSDSTAETTNSDSEDVLYMDNFIAVAPRGETIFNRLAPGKKAFQYVVVGYEDNTGELGVFHWTSRTEKAYFKRILLSLLRKARQRGAALSPENLHVLRVEQVEEVPENAVEFIRGSRHFMPAPKLSTTEKLAAVMGHLEANGLTAEDREALEAEVAKLQERLAQEAMTSASSTPEEAGTADSITPEELSEELGEDEEVTYRTKRAAVAVATERGLTPPADYVLKVADNRWAIVTRD